MPHYTRDEMYTISWVLLYAGREKVEPQNGMFIFEKHAPSQ